MIAIRHGQAGNGLHLLDKRPAIPVRENDERQTSSELGIEAIPLSEGSTTIGGFTIPSSDTVFLGIVTIHITLGLCAVATGLAAMLSEKRPGRHPRFGTLYFWFLAGLFVSATVLSVMRWAHAYHQARF